MLPYIFSSIILIYQVQVVSAPVYIRHKRREDILLAKEECIEDILLAKEECIKRKLYIIT